MDDDLDIYLVVQPALEAELAAEANAHGFDVAQTSKGGVTLKGGWPDVWRANLTLRGATRVLVRLTSFPAVHLAQLDKRARKLPWSQWLRADLPVRVEATCKRSKIYHDRAAAQRISGAITDVLAATISKEADLTLKLRIEDNLCTLSLDSSGEPLHRRGHKQALNKAPLRESLAALFLRSCGYDGDMPVFDPMCGSGTFPIEAAEIAAGFLPGRSRTFAFQQLASFDAAAFDALKNPEPREPAPLFFGSDRDTGAILKSQQNAERAGVQHLTSFEAKPISAVTPPCDTPGLVIVNPPYGGRIGNKKPLYGLYASFGEVMRRSFKGWRVAMITSEPGLAKTTGLPWANTGPRIDHGGIGVKLYQTGVLS